MVAWIGQDCWNIINSFKEDLEEQEKHKERMRNCMLEMFKDRRDYVDGLYNKRRKYRGQVKQMFVFLSKDFIIKKCRGRSRDNEINRVILNARHLRVNIVLIDDIEDCREIPQSIIRNIRNIDQEIMRNRYWRDRGFLFLGQLNNIGAYRFR